MAHAGFVTPACGRAVAMAPLGGLLSCSRTPSTTITPAVLTAKIGPPVQYDAEKVVNVYSWADYIAPDTVANFEQETGIIVQYDTVDWNRF